MPGCGAACATPFKLTIPFPIRIVDFGIIGGKPLSEMRPTSKRG